MERTNRTEVKIHLDNLSHNLKLIRRFTDENAEIIAVVKDNAYGHGIAGTYKTFIENGVTRFAVGFWQEGKALRDAGCKEPIHILSDTMDNEMDMVLKYGLQPSIYTLESAMALSKVAAAKSSDGGETARKSGTAKAEIQIAIDTGMNRIGFKPGEKALKDIVEISRLPNIKISGAFTHFANADEEVSPRTEAQFRMFTDFISEVEREGVEIPFKHVANSASIILYPEVHLDGVRAGDIMFGLPVCDGDKWSEIGFKEVMEWDTYVAHVKTVPPGTEIGYSGTFTTERETVIATIPVGHGDGFRRQLSNKGFVKVKGKLAPIIGLICMDTFMADVTDIAGVKRGDEVILMGEDISAVDMAELLNVSLDEIVEVIHPRVPRVYVR